MTDPTTTEIAFHDIKHMKAASYTTKGMPLVLTIETSFGNAEIILYMDDQHLADALAIVINGAMEARLLSSPPVAEAAAYAAANAFYNGGLR